MNYFQKLAKAVNKASGGDCMSNSHVATDVYARFLFIITAHKKGHTPLVISQNMKIGRANIYHYTQNRYTPLKSDDLVEKDFKLINEIMDEIDMEWQENKHKNQLKKLVSIYGEDFLIKEIRSL